MQLAVSPTNLYIKRRVFRQRVPSKCVRETLACSANPITCVHDLYHRPEVVFPLAEVCAALRAQL